MNRHDNQFYVFSALILAFGDIVALMLFTFFGSLEHQLDLGFMQTLNITLPFIAGWLVAGLLWGSYRVKAYTSAWRTFFYVLKTAVLAVPLGLLIRWFCQDKPATLVFGVVSFLFIVLFLALWRWLFAWIHQNM